VASAGAAAGRADVNDLFDIDDPEFLSELEALLDDPGAHRSPTDSAFVAVGEEDDLAGLLNAVLAPQPDEDRPAGEGLSEEAFASLSVSELTQRTTLLLETCRRGGHGEAVQAVASFIVFFQALVPTLEEEAAPAVKAVFFRLVPTLLHIAFHDFSSRRDDREPGREALKQLESILLEISSVRLTPGERQLVIRSLDQMADLIGAGDYTIVTQIVSSRLLRIIQKNKLTRALFRLMEVEATIQVYLKEVLGCSTPEIRVPDDVESLGPYGPVRIFDEDASDGRGRRRFIQIHIPNIPILRDVVLKLVEGDARTIDLRMDALGTAPLDVPSGKYSLGLVYQPQEEGGGA
jgi:hypothetical protein